VSAAIIPLASRRKAPAPLPCPTPDRLPLVIQAHPGAVAVIADELEWWLDPTQAREIAASLLACADEAEGSRP
jgi:hypothetical protein